MNELTDMQELERMGSVFVKSKFFADTTDAAQAIVKIMAGRELGIAPIAAMTGIHIIKGKPSLGANLQAAKIKSSGKYNYRVKQNTAAICEIEFFERTANDWQSVGVSTFTIEDARKAGTQNIEKYPRNMLFARAMSNGAKWFCPDAFGGIAPYVPEELGVSVDENGDVVDGAIVPIQELTGAATAQPQAEGLVPGTSPLPQPVKVPSKQNGDTVTRQSFFAFASEHGLNQEAAKIATAHSKDQDWNAAMTELKEVAAPALAAA